MTNSLNPLFRHFLICAALFAVAELSPFATWQQRFYKPDGAHAFATIYYLSLFAIGLTLRVHRTSRWWQAVFLGALCGSISGVLAYLGTTIAVGRLGDFLQPGALLELPGLLGIGVLVSLTPLWGICSACADKLIRSGFELR